MAVGGPGGSELHPGGGAGRRRIEERFAEAERSRQGSNASMMITVFREIVGLLKGRKKEQGKVCPNGHVMHPSWDQCPYCLEMQQAMMGGGGGGGGGMVMPPSGGGNPMVNMSDLGGGGGSAAKGRRSG